MGGPRPGAEGSSRAAFFRRAVQMSSDSGAKEGARSRSRAQSAGAGSKKGDGD
eukprot:gene16653-10393_t